jgi:hypothetical protein
VRRFVFLTFLLVLCAAAFTVRCWNLRDVFVEGHIYFSDPDCYSRMTRAGLVDQGHGLFQRHHDFENYPAGVSPHTTAPLDWMIVVLKRMLGFGFRISDLGRDSVLRTEMLDVAGAIISPLLGAVLCGWLVWALARTKDLPRFAAWAAGIFAAVSPIMVHGTLLGRPDHQSLLLVLLAVALAAELRLCGELTRRWSLASGIAWGLACWVSLYEPLIVFVVVAAYWLCADRARFSSRECRAGWIAFGTIVVLTTLLEGWRITLPDAAMREFFTRWSRSIGELKHPNFALVTSWLGWLAVFAPVLLVVTALRAVRMQRGSEVADTESGIADHAAGSANRPCRSAALLLVLLLTLAALTAWQVRWGYFLALVFALALPWIFTALRRAWIAWPVFLISLWPIAQDWDRHLFPGDDILLQKSIQRREIVELRGIAKRMLGPDRAGFLAPWWLSPALAYWSGQPGVAGSSHESLPGIVDASAFFLATTPLEAAEILRRREVRTVVADIPAHVLPISAEILGRAAPREALGAVLGAEEPKAPVFLLEPPPAPRAAISEAPFYRLYRVDTTLLPPPPSAEK